MTIPKLSFHNKILLILLFLTGFNVASNYAQSWQTLYDSTEYYWGKDWELCAALYEQAAILAEKQFGKTDTLYALTINDLAICYVNLGKYTEAEPLYQKAISIYEFQSFFNHSDYASSLNNLASLYETMGRYIEAEELCIKAEELSKTQLGENHPSYATSLNNLALLYKTIGRYTEAEELYLKAKEIRKKQLGENHPLYAQSLNNLALLYKTIGRYTEAEELYLEAKKINKTKLGENHPRYATSLNNLALLYKIMSRYTEAEELFLKAREIRKKQLGENHPDYAQSLNNLAGLYKIMGRYIEAEELYLQSKEIFKTRLGENHPDYAATLNNLALLYYRMGRYTEAEELYLQSKEIWKTQLGVNHPSYTTSLNNLAALYHTMGHYNEAEELHLKAKEIKKIKLGENHPSYATSLINLAGLYEKRMSQSAERIAYMEFYDKAVFFYRQALDKFLYHIEVYFPAMSEKEKGEFFKTIKGDFERYYSFVTNTVILSRAKELVNKEHSHLNNKFLRFAQDDNTLVGNSDQDNITLVGNLYNYRLATKALLFNSTNKVRERIMSSTDTALIQNYKQWQSKRDYLAKLFTLSKAEIERQGVSISDMQKEVNSLEKELSKASELFVTRTDNPVWQDVQAALDSGEAAVEIIRFRKYGRIYDTISLKKNRSVRAGLGDSIIVVEKDGFTDTVYYMALILKNLRGFQNLVGLVLLDNGNELEKKYLYNYKNSLKYKIKDDDSYEQYWARIAKQLKGIKKVYFSADGVYNQINLQTLQNPETGKFLIDEMDVQLVTSTKDLFTDANIRMNANNTNTPTHKSSKTASLYGYINYENTLVMDGHARPLQELPGTKKEILTIDSLLNQNHYESIIHQWNDATVQAIKSEQSPTILHIATHGYFLSDKEITGRKIFGIDSIYYIMNPLLRSGLMFAGSSPLTPDPPEKEKRGIREMERRNESENRGIGETEKRKTKQFTDSPIHPVTDSKRKVGGVLSAYEAMNLNLDNTELVVLSACETGLGDVAYGEGVYGLQRAFHQAGAKSVIMSLWKVSDRHTQELMTTFYSSWLSGTDKRKAFKEAQLEMKEKYKYPYFWGAFVMVGG